MILFHIFVSLLLAQQPDPRQKLIEAGNQERTILSELEEIDQKLKTLISEKALLETQQEQIKERRKANMKQESLANKELLERKKDLQASLQTLYQLHRKGLARIVFGTEDPTTLRRRSSYLYNLIELS